MSPEEIKQAITKVLKAENKAKELLNIFGSTQNMQLELTTHVESFVDEIVQITKEFFKPIIADRGELPDREVMAKLLDNSFDALIEHNTVSGYYQNNDVKTYIDVLTKAQLNYPKATDYFRYSISCFLLELENSGKNYLKLSIIEIVNSDKFLGSINQQAIESEIKSKTASRAAKAGADKRWEAKENTRLFAIELAEKGEFANTSQAAKKITETVFEYGKNVGFHFSEIFQANKTIYNWLLAEKKKKTVKVKA